MRKVFTAEGEGLRVLQKCQKDFDIILKGYVQLSCYFRNFYWIWSCGHVTDSSEGIELGSRALRKCQKGRPFF